MDGRGGEVELLGRRLIWYGGREDDLRRFDLELVGLGKAATSHVSLHSFALLKARVKDFQSELRLSIAIRCDSGSHIELTWA